MLCVDWLTGARLRGDMDEKYHGHFFLLDVKRAKRESSWSDGDNAILSAIIKLRNLCDRMNYILYRVGGDEFVLVADEAYIRKLVRKRKDLLKTFHAALDRKVSTESWLDALDRAWSRLKKRA